MALRLWRTEALNESGVSAEGTGWASCSKGYRVRVSRTKRLDVPAEALGAVTARCRRDEAVAGGGWTTRGENGARGLAIAVARPLDLGDKGNVPDDGWTVRGWPVSTMVRGEWVVKGGELVGAPGAGRFVERSSVCQRPGNR